MNPPPFAATTPQNPNPQPLIYPYTQSYPSHYQYFPQNPNPIVQLQPTQPSVGTHEQGITPPGVESYTQSSTDYLGPEGQAGLPSGQQYVVSASASAGYYSDPNVLNWGAQGAVGQYGVDPAAAGYGAVISVTSNGSAHFAVENSAPAWLSDTQPHINQARKKYLKKTKLKNVQSAFCEVCGIDCNSKDVLDQHKLGKKHKKNLEKLRQALNPTPSLVQSNGPVIGPQERPNVNTGKSGSSKKNKKTAESLENLETKKRKVLEGGAAADAVRICSICNVVCNSETVYNYHLAGQKHAALARKLASGT